MAIGFSLSSLALRGRGSFSRSFGFSGAVTNARYESLFFFFFYTAEERRNTTRNDATPDGVPEEVLLGDDPAGTAKTIARPLRCFINLFFLAAAAATPACRGRGGIDAGDATCLPHTDTSIQKIHHICYFFIYVPIFQRINEINIFSPMYKSNIYHVSENVVSFVSFGGNLTIMMLSQIEIGFLCPQTVIATCFLLLLLICLLFTSAVSQLGFTSAHFLRPGSDNHRIGGLVKTQTREPLAP